MPFQSPWLTWTRRHRRLFLVGGAALGVVFLSLGVWWSGRGPGEVVLYALLAVGVGVGVAQQRRLRYWRQRARSAERHVVEAHRQLSLVFRLSHQVADAASEEEVIDLILHLAVEGLGLPGAAFVPLDERGQPLPARVETRQPLPNLDAWAEHLASPHVRASCVACVRREGQGLACPVLESSPFRQFNPDVRVVCWPVQRGGRSLGMLVLCLEQDQRLTEEQRALIRLATQETGVALEGVRARRQEMQLLADLPLLARRADWNERFQTLLGQVAQALEADGACMVWEAQHVWTWQRDEEVRALMPSLTALAREVAATGKPTPFGRTPSGFPEGEAAAVLAVPLLDIQGEPVGALAVLRTQRPFQRRQVAILRTMAAQLALLLAEQSPSRHGVSWILEERRRLAREIHDGLAQTLGYLKLRAAQMGQWLRRGMIERLEEEWDSFYGVLGDAYKEVRQAIDGLRINPLENDLLAWLQAVAQSFQEQSALQVEVESEPGIQVPPEAQIHLVRVVQEALSNVRKHSEAQRVWVRLYREEQAVVLEVEDDGRGFEVDAVPRVARHGLEGMRERAEMLGAELRIWSRPGQGTRVCLRMPLAAEPEFPIEKEA